MQNPKTQKVTDFVSFYSLPSTIMNHEKHNLLNAAYLFYYGTETVFEPGAEESGRLKKRLEELVGDALVIADKAEFDVFNALTLMDNVSFLQDLKVRLLRVHPQVLRLSCTVAVAVRSRRWPA